MPSTGPLPPPRWLAAAALLVLPLAAPLACSNGGGGSFTTGMGTRDFRAIAGVSMGAYGALNLGTKHRDTFGAIGSLGGPVDMRELLAYVRDQNLEVKPVLGIPMDVNEDDFTWDLLPHYPSRDDRIEFTKDLVLAFGNPTLHHPDPGNAYLALDSEPATLGADDVWGDPFTPAAFEDGGDANEDGLRQVGEPAFVPVGPLLLAASTLESAFGETGDDDVGGRTLADTDDDGAYDLGDGIVINMNEPFTDTNDNGLRDAGEGFDDFGLDGVDGTGDFGEGNGRFDEDPDIATWLAEDPLTRIRDTYTSFTLERQRLYMDVGTEDELAFLAHYDNLVPVIEAKGVEVVEVDGFGNVVDSCFDFPEVGFPHVLIRYEGNHVGFDEDALRADLEDFSPDVCGSVPIWQRLLFLLAAMDAAFPDGLDGALLPQPSDIETHDIPSPALAPEGEDPPLRRVLVYRPPAFFNTDRTLPVLYFLGGHGQAPEDFEQVRVLLDLLIGAGEIQNLFVVFLPGAGGTEGSFYVNHAVSESQVPGLAPVTSGRYEDSIMEDLIPVVEREILERRVR